ncbi:unnamed protein product [Alopecurus aequalis]
MMPGQEGPHRWWPSRYHHRDDDPPPPPPPPPNGSSAATIILRLCVVMLAIASATVMAASSECTPRSGAVVTFTYTRFRAFVLLVGCNITAAILEAAAVYLQLSISVAAATAPADDDKTMTEMEEEEEEEGGISAAEVMLALVDMLVPALLYSAMAATYTAAEIYGDQIGACARFAGQVVQAKILSLAACAAVTLAGVAKGLPLPFNVPPVLG